MRSKLTLLMISSVLSLLLTSCNRAEFEEFSELGSLRILGVVADSPEVDGTATGTVNISLTPVISDIDGAGRTFAVTVVSCLDTGFVQSSQPSCENPTVEAYPNGGTFNTTGLAASDFTGAMDPITISINNPASLIADFSSTRRFNGVSYFVIFNLQSGSENFTFVKELVITERTPLNQNPVIDSIQFNGSAIATGPSTTGELSMEFTPAGEPETYQEQRSDGVLESITESYLITWFYSSGKVSPGRILTDQSSTFKPENSTAIRLVGVVKDRRGGTAFVNLSP